MFAFFAVAAPSISPPIPEITYGPLTDSGTKITATIDNYSSDYSYAATSTQGTLNRVGANITITGLTSGTDVNIVVIATSARGLSTPSSAVTDRQPYTYRTETRTGTRLVDTTSCYPASPGPTCPFGGVVNLAGTECCVASSYTEEYTFEVQILNAGPTGYLDSGFDWYKVSNVSIDRIAYTYHPENYTYTYGCTVTCSSPSTCSRPATCERSATCYGITTCYGTATYYNWGCGGTGCCVCPDGMQRYGCICAYQCQYSTPCTEYYPCTEDYPCTNYYPCPGTCTGYGTRQVKDATPSGYTDSGVDWYKFV